MPNASTLSPQSLRPIIWQRHRVITTESLASVYGTDSKIVQKNHARNSDRFEEGKHFFKLEGEPLREFKQQTVFKTVSVGKNARSLMLWTERGAMQHAKMLETDTAWKVFESLVDLYFAKRAERLRSTASDRRDIAHAVIDISLDRHVSPTIVQGNVNRWAGVVRSRHMSVKQVFEAEDYCGRLKTRQESPDDVARVDANSLALHGHSGQLTLQLLDIEKETAGG